MRPLSLKQLLGLVAGLLLAQLAAPAAAQPLSRSGASSHDHSTAAKGGATLTPASLSLAPASTATFAGATKVGTAINAVSVTTPSYTATIRGGVTEVAITTFSAASAVYFTGIVSSYTHVIELRAKQESSIAVGHFRFDEEAGTVYEWVTHRAMRDGSHDIQAAASDAECQFTGTANLIATEGINTFLLRLVIVRGIGQSADKMWAQWNLAFVASDGNRVAQYGSCYYNTAAAGNGQVSLKLYPTAGTWTGVARVMAEVPGVAF